MTADAGTPRGFADEELIVMIRERNPEDLTPEECAALLAAARRSPEVGRELRGRIELEQHLAHVLGEPRVEVQRILAAGRRGGLAGNPTRLAFLVAAGLVAAAAVVLAVRLVRRGPEPDRQVAAAGPAAEAEAGQTPAGDDQPGLAADDPPVEPTLDEPPAAIPTPATDASQPEPAAPPSEPPLAAEPAPPPVVVPAPPLPPPEPWMFDPELQAAGSPAGILFAVPREQRPPPSRDLIGRWFLPAAAPPTAYGVRKVGQAELAAIDGLVRLEPGLVPGLALRLAISDAVPCRIHAWSGDRGVSLISYPPDGRWAAYETARFDADPLPSGWRLVATDRGRWARTAAPAFELRFADGLLTLARGDVRVIEAPLPGPAAEIFFEGSLTLRDIAVTDAAPLATPPLDHGIEPAAADAVAIMPPPDAWRTTGEFGTAASLAATAAGGVELTAEGNPQPVWAAFPLPGSGPRQLLVQVDQAQPGTGVCLVDAAGRAQKVLAFAGNAVHRGRLQLEVVNPNELKLEMPGQPTDRRVPLVSMPLWLRITACGTVTRIATSHDGRLWAESPIAGVPPPAAVGLFAMPHPSRRTIRMGAALGRDLPALHGLAPADLILLADEVPAAAAFGPWREAALAKKPARAEDEAWLRASGLKQLAGNCGRELAIELLGWLWQQSLEQPAEAAGRLRLADEIATLMPSLELPAAAERVAAMYADIGFRAANSGEERPWTLVAAAMQQAPVAGTAASRPFSDPLARRELLQLASTGRWRAFADVLERIAFYGLVPEQPPVAFYQWATAGRDRWLGGGGEAAAGVPADWSHPVVVEPVKDAVTLGAELEASLADQDWRQVYDILAGGIAADTGLIPAGGDPDRAISLSTATSLIVRDHPAFTAVVAADYAPLAALRLRQAIDAADAATVDALARQLAGTEPAAEAHLWLGDRSLAAGEFAVARRYYREARRGTAPGLAERLAVSEALADALLGRTPSPAGPDRTETVAIGDAALPAAEWRSLAETLAVARAGRAAAGRSGGEGLVAGLPAARGYEAVVRGRVEGDLGANPQAVPADYAKPAHPEWPRDGIDWVARQTTLTAAGGRLLVSNRFQLASFDASGGQLQWRAGLGGEAGNAHDWPGQPMRPVATATRAFVRRLTKAGPRLAAVELADGKVAWETAATPDRWLVSDPVLEQDSLHACIAAKEGGGFRLSLATFDAATGRPLAERPLTMLRASWWGQRDCQLVPLADGLLVTCGGGLIRCDPRAGVQWIRRQFWVPPVVDPLWVLQSQQPPLVDGDRGFVVQPGVPAVAAIDLLGGSQAWIRGMPGVRRVLGLVRPAIAGQTRRLVVVEQGGGLTALDAGDGSPVWHAALPNLLAGCLVAESEGLLVAESEPVAGAATRRPVLVWLDAADGRIRRRSPLEPLDDPLPRLGPMVAAGDRIWSLFGRGPADPIRELVECLPR